jgi:hypothetical protein
MIELVKPGINDYRITSSLSLHYFKNEPQFKDSRKRPKKESIVTYLSYKTKASIVMNNISSSGGQTTFQFNSYSRNSRYHSGEIPLENKQDSVKRISDLISNLNFFNAY